MFQLDRADWKKVQCGSRIVIRYADKNWYACKVLEENDRTGKASPSNFLLQYEDGSTEWTNLARSEFKWQDFYVATDDKNNIDSKGEGSSGKKENKKKLYKFKIWQGPQSSLFKKNPCLFRA